MPRQQYIHILLLISILAEACTLLFLPKQHILNNTLNAIIHFIASSLTGILIIAKFYNKQVVVRERTQSPKNYLVPILSLLPVLWIMLDANKVFKQIEINVQWSDIIPAIQIITRRFASGGNPYLPMTELGYTTPVGYMPFHWLPYSLAELGHFDYRWISIGALMIACILVVARVYKRNNNAAIITVMSIVLSYFLISKHSTGIMAVTVELLIAAYYMLFISSINSNKYLAVGTTIALCLLSRYNFVLWLPLAIFIYYTGDNKKLLLQASMIVTALILTCYIIPFLSKDWSVFYKTNMGYAGMNWEWQHLCDNGLPCNLFNGVGFAHLFYKQYGQANFQIAFAVCRIVFFIASMGVCLLMGIWYWKYKTSIDHRIFLMASLKIYLSMFFAFMIVPYDYLMITGLFVSIALYAEQARYKIA
jgi:hypothetical protein